MVRPLLLLMIGAAFGCLRRQWRRPYRTPVLIQKKNHLLPNWVSA